MFRLDVLMPDGIADDAPLVGGSLDLDSCDLLELALCIEETFGIAARVPEAGRAPLVSSPLAPRVFA